MPWPDLHSHANSCYCAPIAASGKVRRVYGMPSILSTNLPPAYERIVRQWCLHSSRICSPTQALMPHASTINWHISSFFSILVHSLCCYFFIFLFFHFILDAFLPLRLPTQNEFQLSQNEILSETKSDRRNNEWMMRKKRASEREITNKMHVCLCCVCAVTMKKEPHHITYFPLYYSLSEYAITFLYGRSQPASKRTYATESAMKHTHTLSWLQQLNI